MKVFFVFLLTLLPPLVFAQEVALTFDDAPTFDSPLFSYQERAERIRKQLSNHRVTAAFFVITGNINSRNAEQLRAYTAEGHVLGNHTHSHYSPSRVNINQYLRDIQVADSILQGWENVKPWYRYPYLNEGSTKSKRDSIRTELRSLGLLNGYVTIDNYDWYINGALTEALRKKSEVDYVKLKEFYIDHIYQSLLFYDRIARKTIGRSPRHVLLLHENDLAALFLGDLIDSLKERGWKIIPPADAFDDPIAKETPDVLFNGQGRVGALAFEKGIPSNELVQPSEDEAYLGRKLAEQGVFSSVP
jgi:peptidoglycan-N-acetylglucosamine deacetylase